MNIFTCKNCQKKIQTKGPIGTNNRNHCPFCLFSLHLDEKNAGDRKSKCKGKMKTIALTFKKNKKDKYSKNKKGELMLVHKCNTCAKYSINRLASDDDSKKILKLLNHNLEKNELLNLKNNKIEVINENDKREVLIQLFGKII